MKNIFITGANGFIGRALCDKLLADGYQVRGAESENIKCKIIRQQQGETDSCLCYFGTDGGR